jgi:hypothetical protein
MKVLLILAFAACAWGNSLRYYAWSPHKEFIYRFESQVLSGLPAIHATHAAGLRLRANVRVQSFPDYTLRIRIEQPTFMTINGAITTFPSVAGAAGGAELLAHLGRPFEVQLKRGAVEKVIVEAGEPDEVINVKKALLAQLQLDLSATGAMQSNVVSYSSLASEYFAPQNWPRLQDAIKYLNLPERMLPKEQSPFAGAGLSELSFFKTVEQSLLGECETEYTVHPLPTYQAAELEAKWAGEAAKAPWTLAPPALGILPLVAPEIISAAPSEAELSCRGKPYFEVTKTTNFDSCRQRPVYVQLMGMYTQCDATKASCGEVFADVHATKYVICGSPEEFFIRRLEAQHTAVMNALPWQTQEKHKLTGRVVVELVKVQDLVTAPLPKPATAEERTSLIYGYPVGAGKRLTAAQQDQAEALTGIRPILPPPALRAAPVMLIPATISNADAIVKVKTLVLKLAEEVFKSPESCGCTNDAAGHIVAIARVGRYLSTAELKTLEAAIFAAAGTPEIKAVAAALVHDVAAMIGTNAATMFVVDHLIAGKITGERAIQVAQMTIASIKTPTEELVRAVFGAIKTFKTTHPHLFHTGLHTLGDLVFRAFVHPISSVNEFPVNIYGKFELPQSTLVTEVVTYLTAELEATVGVATVREHHRLVLVAALSKIGHVATIKPLLKVAEGGISTKPMVRAIAVYGLKRLAILHPSVVKPILLAVIDNAAENAEVRIAAVAILPNAQPTFAEMHKIAIRSWFEPSLQVTSFIYSTLWSLSTTEDPALLRLREAAATVLPMMKPVRVGIQFSQNVIVDKFVRYIRAIPFTHIKIVQSEMSPLPAKASFKTFVKIGPSVVRGLELSAYTQGMDFIVDQAMTLLRPAVVASPEITAELAKITNALKITARAPSSTQPEMHFKFGFLGMERYLGFDAVTFGAIKEAIKGFTFGPAFEKKFTFTKAIKAIEFQVAAPTATGFPVYAETTVPLLISAKAAIRTEGATTSFLPQIFTGAATGDWAAIFGKKIPTKFVFDVKAVVNTKVQSHIGVVCPFTGEYIASGVDVNLHASLPVMLEAAYNGKGMIEAKIATPRDVQGRQELLHVYAKPYTTIMRLSAIMPVGRTPAVKEIIAAAEPIKKFTIPIGARFGLGLDTVVEIESNSRLVDLQAIYETARQHSIFTFPTLAMIPSVRKNSFRIFYNPSTSETKEIVMRFAFAFGVKETEVAAAKVTAHPISALMQGNYMEHLVKAEMKTPIVDAITKLKAGMAFGMNIEAGFKSAYGFAKKVETGVVIAHRMIKEEARFVVKQLIVAKAKMNAAAGAFNFEVATTAAIPRIMHWWSKEALIAQPLKATVETHFRMGQAGGVFHEIHALITGAKCEAHKTAIANSAEFARCAADEAMGRKLTRDCMFVRHQASAFDKFTVALAFQPQTFAKFPWIVPVTQRFEEIIKAFLLPTIAFKQLAAPLPTGKVVIEAAVAHTGDLATASWTYGAQTVQATNVRLPAFKGLNIFTGLLPLSARHNIFDTILEKFTGNLFPATCRVDRGFVTTFDNVAFPHTINECEHLLLKDCSGTIPAAITAMKTAAGETRVKILAGTVKAELVGSKAAGVMKVTVNGAAKTVAIGQTVAIANAAGATVFVVTKFADGVVAVRTPTAAIFAPLMVRLEVFFDGERVEIVGPTRIRNRMCGICGDLNMEKTADLKSPAGCVFSKKRFAIYSYQVPTAAGTCPAIPAAEKADFTREATQCFTKVEIQTPLSKLLGLVDSMYKSVMAKHKVVAMGNSVCISKSALNVCGHGLIPAEVGQRNVAYTCMVKGQAVVGAEPWGATELAARARAGVPLSRELAGKATHQRMVELEPIACKGANGVVDYMLKAPRV